MLSPSLDQGCNAPRSNTSHGSTKVKVHAPFSSTESTHGHLRSEVSIDTPSSGAPTPPEWSPVDSTGDAISQLSTEISTKIAALCQDIETYFGLQERTQSLTSVIQQAFKDNDTEFGIYDAIQWADGFIIPDAAIAHDVGLFRASGLNFDKMAELRFRWLLTRRFNRDRVIAVISPDNPDYSRMLQLADGMGVPVPTDFVPNGGHGPPLRKRYQLAHAAVNKLNHQNWEDKLAFYLPLPMVRELIPGCHLSPAHWTIKKGKACGRNLFDSSDDSIPNSTLNAPEIRDRATSLWGPIEHPTIVDIVKMIIDFYDSARAADPTITWDDIVLWKMDLKGAYTLLCFRPEKAKLFGIEVTNDGTSPEGQYAMFFLCGVFGWTGTPYAFQVCTRAIVFEFSQLTRGDARMYVDDLIGVCLLRDLSHEQALAHKLITDLFGEGAVAEHKTEHGRRLDAIGYTIDLNDLRVTISRKNFLKTLYGYFSVDIEKPVPRRTLEKLASWGSRYSFICRFMKPFNRALYSALPRPAQRASGHYNQHASTTLPVPARRAIRLWRAMLCCLHLDETRFSRSFDQFRGKHADMVCEFDSSLAGSGLLFYRVNPDGSETVVGGAAISLTSLGFAEDSSFQNMAEFIAVVITLRVLRSQYPTVTSIALRGDSISALTWASKGNFRGDIITQGSLLYTLILIATGIEIVSDPIHLCGDDNWRCDGLSRGKTMSDLGMAHVTFFDLNRDPLAHELVTLCDPNNPIESESDFLTFYKRCNAAIANISSRLYHDYIYQEM